MTRILRGFIASAAILLTLNAIAQQPQLKNAKLQTISATGVLADQITALAGQQPGSAWIGYSVPAVAGHHNSCCYGSGDGNGCCGTCYLEGNHENFQNWHGDCDNDNEPDATSIVVFYRVEERKISNIRFFTPNCVVDAGGLPVIGISNVDPKQSVVYLSGLVSKDGESRLGKRALDVIAQHADSSADAALDRFVAPSSPEKIREHAAFWLGVERGQHGYETIKRLIESDPDDHFREKLTFDLSQSKQPQSQDELIHVAKQDADSRVRSQALFWLAQKAGKKVAAVIGDAIENDPDTDVKKRAVFALSQLPDHEGVPKLIEVAKSNRNPVVRKQAVFWLGQSNDPRALGFIEAVLEK
jgi:hypothetical protein